eukprot:330785_1
MSPLVFLASVIVTLLYICCLVTSFTDNLGISSYELKLDDNVWSNSSAQITITLWWKSNIYQCFLLPNGIAGTVYSCDANATFVGNQCDSNPYTSKILIQNKFSSDAVEFGSIKIITENGTYYNIESFCGDENNLGTSYNDYFLVSNNNVQCNGLSQYNAICINKNNDGDCNPSDLLINFDVHVNESNVTIHGALIEDGSYLLPITVNEDWYQLNPTNAAILSSSCYTKFEYEKICINSTKKPYINGLYDLSYWDYNLNSAAYFQQSTAIYVYPWLSASDDFNYFYYYIDENNTNSYVYAYCFVGAYEIDSDYIPVLNLNECIGRWWIWNGAWVSDTDMTVESCTSDIIYMNCDNQEQRDLTRKCSNNGQCAYDECYCYAGLTGDICNEPNVFEGNISWYKPVQTNNLSNFLYTFPTIYGFNVTYDLQYVVDGYLKDGYFKFDADYAYGNYEYKIKLNLFEKFNINSTLNCNNSLNYDLGYIYQSISNTDCYSLGREYMIELYDDTSPTKGIHILYQNGDDTSCSSKKRKTDVYFICPDEFRKMEKYDNINGLNNIYSTFKVTQPSYCEYQIEIYSVAACPYQCITQESDKNAISQCSRNGLCAYDNNLELIRCICDNMLVNDKQDIFCDHPNDTYTPTSQPTDVPTMTPLHCGDSLSLTNLYYHTYQYSLEINDTVEVTIDGCDTGGWIYFKSIDGKEIDSCCSACYISPVYSGSYIFEYETWSISNGSFEINITCTPRMIGTVQCNDSISGSTIIEGDTNQYIFKIQVNDNGVGYGYSVFFDSYHTPRYAKLYFKSMNDSIIKECDEWNCGWNPMRVLIPRVYSGNYIFEIGADGDIVSYQVNITCKPLIAIKCDDSISGSIISSYDEDQYLFQLNDTVGYGYSVLFDSCNAGSNFDTYLYFKSIDDTIISQTSRGTDPCINNIFAQLSLSSVYSGDYIFAITGDSWFGPDTGSYQVNVICNTLGPTTEPTFPTNIPTNEPTFPTNIPTYAPTVLLECGDSISGATISAYDTNQYMFQLNDNGIGFGYSVMFDSCNSEYDTYLYFKAMNGTVISQCDNDEYEYNCGACDQEQLEISPVFRGNYLFEIGGFSTRYGTYEVTVTCKMKISSSKADQIISSFVKNASLPHKDCCMATGYHNGSIFILGGGSYRFQLTEYDIMNNNVIDYGQNLSYSVGGSLTKWGQYYVQINHLLYIVSSVNTDRFIIFNMKTKISEEYIPYTHFYSYTGYSRGCITSYKEVIFVLNQYKCYQFNVTDAGLSTYCVPRDEERYEPGCQYVHDYRYLYVFGGNDYYGEALNTVERTTISQFNAGSGISWQYTDDLLQATKWTKSVLYNSNIFVIAGLSNGGASNLVQRIDGLTGSVTSAGFIDIAVYLHAAILTDGVSYLFGGGNSDIIQCFELITNEANNYPSLSPTSATNLPSTSPEPIFVFVTSSFSDDDDDESTTMTVASFINDNLYIFIAAISMFIILFFCCYYVKRRKTNKNKDETFEEIEFGIINNKMGQQKETFNTLTKIYNPLIICCGIEKYENENFENLPQIKDDINRYQQVFESKYGYKMEINDINQPFSPMEIKKYLTQCRRNIITEDDGGSIIKRGHDGVIVCMLAHGDVDSVICSNSEKITLQNIRQIFSNEEEMNEIPKIFLIDLNVDNKKYDQNGNKNNVRSAGHKNFSSTIMIINKNNENDLGKLSVAITKVLDENYEKNMSLLNENRNWMNFRDIRLKTKEYIENDAQKVLINNEHDDDIDRVIFVPNKTK